MGPKQECDKVRQDFPIVLMSFSRPDLLEQVANSLSQQIEANINERPVALFQDGAVNRYSGIRRADDVAIRANVEIFKHYFPYGRTFVADHNLGVALNFERAERYAFEELNQDAALFFEDDLLLSPFYVNALDQLVHLALKDDRIGYVSAYGIQGPLSSDANSEPLRYETLGHLWGFGLTKQLWQRNRRFVEPYLELVRNTDYRQRDVRAVARLFSSWGMGCPATSQDVVKHMACVLNDASNLNLSFSLGKYIGSSGLHMNPEWFAFLGYDRTELYHSRLTCLPVPDEKTLADIGRVHSRWATEIASPFPSEGPIPGFELWNFSVSMANIARVEPALIALQDRLHLSISMLFFCCWHGSQRRPLSRRDLQQAIQHLETWERDVQGCIRVARRTVTGEVSFARSGLAVLVYERSLYQMEQEAFRIGLYELQRFSPSAKTGLPCAGPNIEEYLRLMNVTPSSATEIELLVAASNSVSP